MTDSATSAPQPAAADAETASASGFTLFAVLRRDPVRPALVASDPSTTTGDGIDDAIANVEAAGVTIRGFYDVSGLKADADIMIWLHGPDAPQLQWALRELRRSGMLATLLPTWNAMGVHRDAEFNRSHVPGFLRGERARDWLTVYPFDRSYDWYILDEADRRRMLADHGRKGAAFGSVVANTVAAFALGDYEWILPMESDSLTDLVDMMRDLRATEARLHVRNEVPFFTGRRIAASEILEVIR